MTRVLEKSRIFDEINVLVLIYLHYFLESVAFEERVASESRSDFYTEQLHLVLLEVQG